MSNTKVVTREQAEVVLGAVQEFLNINEGASYGPKLRSHEHEDLPEGCWSIDLEGQSDWPWRFTEALFLGEFPQVDRTAVHCQAANPWLLHIFPA